MERHNENAAKVAAYLADHPQVEAVRWAGLASSPWHERASAITGGKGYGSVPAFVIAGGREAGAKFVEGLTLHSHVANIGDVRSLAIHPASTTHSQLTEVEQSASGVDPAWCACRWAWSRSTTSSPTSTRASPPPAWPGAVQPANLGSAIGLRSRRSAVDAPTAPTGRAAHVVGGRGERPSEASRVLAIAGAVGDDRAGGDRAGSTGPMSTGTGVEGRRTAVDHLQHRGLGTVPML